MEQLKAYVEASGGSASLLEGWTAFRGHSEPPHYISPSGEDYRSRYVLEDIRSIS